jgi:hypothetical protein
LGTNLPKKSTDGAHRRGGWEGLLGYKSSAGDFQYDINANISFFDQLWEMNPNEQESTTKNPRTRNTHVGTYNTIGFHCIGFYEDEADILNSPKRAGSSNLAPGDLKYEDVDGNGIIDDNDRIRIGRGAMPHIMYGFNIDLKYKGWFLNALIQGATQKDVMLGLQFKGDQNGMEGALTWKSQTDFWTPENTDSRFARLITNPYNGSNNIQVSDFWLVDASYCRLKSLQVGYDFRKTLLKKVTFLSNAKIILGGTNLFTISKAQKYGIDPEQGRGDWYSYPAQRVYSLTLNIGF